MVATPLGEKITFADRNSQKRCYCKRIKLGEHNASIFSSIPFPHGIWNLWKTEGLKNQKFGVWR